MDKVTLALMCIIPVVCVTNEMEESVVNQHNQRETVIMIAGVWAAPRRNTYANIL